MKKESGGDNSTQNIAVLFEDQFQTDIFNARCHDTGDSTTLENAKIFKEEFLKRNVKIQNTLNL